MDQRHCNLSTAAHGLPADHSTPSVPQSVPSKIIQIKNKTIQGLLRIMHSSGTMKLSVPISCPSCLLSKRHLVCADNTMNPFHKTVTTRLTVISIVNTQKFVIFIFKKKKSLYFYNTILCIILPLHQITKKCFTLMWGCFWCSVYGRDGKFAHCLLFWLPLSVFLNFLFYWKS